MSFNHLTTPQPEIAAYQDQWVMIDIGGHMTCTGYLKHLELHPNDSSLTLNPHLISRVYSQSLPRRLMLAPADELVNIPAGAPYAITPTSEEELQYLIFEAERDFREAHSKRERRLAKTLERKIDHPHQLFFPFPR